jgi:hypothetical protein
MMQIVRCASCDGYGWVSEFDAGEEICEWCSGNGYVYRTEAGVDQPISPADLLVHADELEQLEVERLHEMGYSGQAKKPWEQAVRQARGILLNGDEA